jgi:hypothetical protein
MGKSVEPIARQFLDTPAELFEQCSRSFSRVANNFQLQTLASGSAHDHELAASMPLEKIFVRLHPARLCGFSPEKHSRAALRKCRLFRMRLGL